VAKRADSSSRFHRPESLSMIADSVLFGNHSFI
jgi:hypothetical protein